MKASENDFLKSVNSLHSIYFQFFILNVSPKMSSKLDSTQLDSAHLEDNSSSRVDDSTQSDDIFLV